MTYVKITFGGNSGSGSSPVTTEGDLIVGDNMGQEARLPIGTSGYVLTSDGTTASWASNPAGFADPMTTRGDIIIRNAVNTTVRLGVGTAGQVLTSDGSDTAWADPNPTWAQIDKTTSDIADITTKSHTSLTDIGTNTHAQIDTHIASTANPHSVTKTQVGLGNVDNTSDLNKPISTATQTALNGKEPTLTKGNLTEATSSVLTITGGTGAIIGSGLTIEVDQADTLNSGYLSSVDWNTFNNKSDYSDPLTTRGDLLIRDISSTTRLPIGAADTVLKSDGTDPAYGKIVNANVDATAAIEGSKLQAASASNAGAITTGTQTIAGAKTFTTVAGGTNSTLTVQMGTGSSGVNNSTLRLTDSVDTNYVELDFDRNTNGIQLRSNIATLLDTDITGGTQTWSTSASDITVALRAGAASSNSTLRLEDNLGSNFFNIDFDRNLNLFSLNSSVTSDILTATLGGNVGIGTNNPLTLLHIRGIGQQAARFYRNTTGSGSDIVEFFSDAGSTESVSASVRANGQYFATVTSIGTESDERLKQNIQPLTGSLDKLNALTPSSWDWKDATSVKESVGIIAQDLELQFPELVTSDGESYEGGEPIKSVSLSGNTMVAHLIKAIQELSAKVDQLESQINV